MHPNISFELQRSGVEFSVRKHADCPFPINGPADFARALGYPIERITKSLYLAANSGVRIVVVCSINKKVNFSNIAAKAQCGRLEVASKDDLKLALGYPPNGVSPIGVSCPVFIDGGIMQFETVLIGGGEAGVEIEVAPDDLIRITAAQILAFAD